MSVTAEDFLLFASELLAKPIQTEIDHRNAAARTYYAVMHLVRSELGINPTLGSHELIKRELLSLPPIDTSPFLREAKRYWRTLYDTRIRADYHTHTSITRDTALASLEIASRIFGLR
jgi:uncharacterized protein (UPF0332 family)